MDLLTPEDESIPPNTLAELRRDMERRWLVSDQIRQIEDARLERIEHAASDGPHATARRSRMFRDSTSCTSMSAVSIPTPITRANRRHHCRAKATTSMQDRITRIEETSCTARIMSAVFPIAPISTVK